MALQDNEELRQQSVQESEELYGFVSDAENERDQAKNQLISAQEQIDALKGRIYYLESLQSDNDPSLQGEVEILEDFESLERMG